MKKFLALMLVVFTLFVFASCAKQLEWPNGKLGSIIPQINGVRGEIEYENLDSLYITLENISKNQYLEYVDACRNKGFFFDIAEESDSYIAFNENGYKIDISYFSAGDMWINVTSPIAMSNFDWPSSEIAKFLPKPKSNYGKIEWEEDYGFVIYVGNTTINEYMEYVDAVYALGFTLDYNKGDDYFYADNADGYSVNIRYEGFNTMFVRIDEPDEENIGLDSESNNEDINTIDSDEITSEEKEYETNTEVNNINLTTENCIELSNILSMKAENAPEYKEFAEKYKGKIIEFDGRIDYITNYKDYNTRYDILVSAGDYDPDHQRGPIFKFENVAAYNLNLDTLYLEEELQVGVNVHIIAKVKSYNSNSYLFFLEPISVSRR